jgi:hypothetical protein
MDYWYGVCVNWWYGVCANWWISAIFFFAALTSLSILRTNAKWDLSMGDFHMLSVDERWTKYYNYDPAMIELYNVLNGYAEGRVIARYEGEEHLMQLLSDGELMRSNHVVSMAGRPSSCHQNVAALIDEDSTPKVVTGYAYTHDDEMWRQHSWALQGDSIIETTESRDKYWGVVLQGADRFKFMKNNAPSGTNYFSSPEGRSFLQLMSQGKLAFEDYRSHFLRARQQAQFGSCIRADQLKLGRYSLRYR